MKNYRSVLSFLIFTAVIALPALLLNYTGNSVWLVPYFWSFFVFMSFITLIILVFMLIIYQKNKEYYAQAFLGATTFKLLLCLVFLLVFIKKNHPDKFVFLVDFAYIYFLNTVFEIYSLLRNLRNQNSA